MRQIFFSFVLILIAFSHTPAIAQIDFNNQGAICVNVDTAYIDQLETEAINASVPEEAQIVEPEAVLLIMDQSGSMSEMIGDTNSTRMEVAKDVLIEYVNSFNPDDQVGLRLLGSTCETSLLQAISPIGDGTAMINQIQSIIPEGYTPLALALEAAAEDLEGIEGIREIVMVTDGEETCEGNPVAAATFLAQSDPNLQISINVVGFNVLDDVSTQDNLRLIPRAGGGIFIAAESEDDLLQALSIISRIPFFISDLAGDPLDDGLANRSSVPVDPESYLVSIPALGIEDQTVTAQQGRGTAINVAADGSISINNSDSDCIAEFCPEVPLSRLILNTRGRVTSIDPSPVNVRNNPGIDASRVGQIEAGEEFNVTDGAICRDGFLWWYIQNDRIEGWAAEGVPGSYFLEPFIP